MDGTSTTSAPPPETLPRSAEPAGEAAVPARFHRWAGLRMHHLLFLAFTLIAAGPLAVLAIWEGRTAFQNELDSVRERHLLVARNLTSTMSRYVRDVRAAFSLAFTNGTLSPPGAGLSRLLTSLDVVHVCVMDPNGVIESTFPNLNDNPAPVPPDPKLIATLRAQAEDARGETILSNLYHDDAGHPVFYLANALPGGRLGLGILSSRYLVTLQKSIAFGTGGHAVIVDSKGQVIAHPTEDWVKASLDISGVPTVAAMMRGETGVGQFWSPAFNSMMIAGYAVVPETGWGVMVPQPISELRRRANQVNELAVVIAGVSFAAAALMSYLVALWLTRPVRTVAATAEAVISGNDHVSVPAPGHWAPSEIHSLGLAFNTMLRDLRRRAAETLRALRQAETSSHAKTQFLANMSHELRTPLNGIVGTLELLRLSGVSPTQQSYLDQANRSSRALLRMVSDVLDLSEMEVGGIELHPVPFHLEALLDKMQAQFAEPLEERHLTLTVTLPDALHVPLLGDEVRVGQMIGHLVGNAIKFTESGGIAIRLSAVVETPDAVTVRFEVGDTGIGIPAEIRERIFDAFTQGDGSMTRRYGGSGLGLAIVRELSQRMNGTFGVDSTVGVGSTFWLTLPFAKARVPVEPAAVPAPLLPAPVALSVPPIQPIPGARPVSVAGRAFQEVLRTTGRASFHVLLVEDNAANLRVTRALLETLGCTVRTATNGVESVDAYRQGNFDLILMDCQMPEMDGYQATRAIRQIEAFDGRSTPIVALTAHAMEGSRDQCLAAGMNDQLSKPLTLAALTAKLREWLTHDQSAA